MTRKDRFHFIIDYFQEHAPNAETELLYDNPFQLLVAVILSAQCTDKRVNMVMPALLEAFPAPEVMAAATPDEIFPFIKSISYPNNKKGQRISRLALPTSKLPKIHKHRGPREWAGERLREWVSIIK
jgi:endonuclease III